MPPQQSRPTQQAPAASAPDDKSASANPLSDNNLNFINTSLSECKCI